MLLDETVLLLASYGSHKGRSVHVGRFSGSATPPPPMRLVDPCNVYSSIICIALLYDEVCWLHIWVHIP